MSNLLRFGLNVSVADVFIVPDNALSHYATSSSFGAFSEVPPLQRFQLLDLKNPNRKTDRFSLEKSINEKFDHGLDRSVANPSVLPLTFSPQAYSNQMITSLPFSDMRLSTNLERANMIDFMSSTKSFDDTKQVSETGFGIIEPLKPNPKTKLGKSFRNKKMAPVKDVSPRLPIRKQSETISSSDVPCDIFYDCPG